MGVVCSRLCCLLLAVFVLLSSTSRAEPISVDEVLVPPADVVAAAKKDLFRFLGFYLDTPAVTGSAALQLQPRVRSAAMASFAELFLTFRGERAASVRTALATFEVSNDSLAGDPASVNEILQPHNGRWEFLVDTTVGQLVATVEKDDQGVPKLVSLGSSELARGIAPLTALTAPEDGSRLRLIFAASANRYFVSTVADSRILDPVAAPVTPTLSAAPTVMTQDSFLQRGIEPSVDQFQGQVLNLKLAITQAIGQ